VDGQRQFPAEPDRWYGEQPEDDLGRVPGQRGADRYTDPESSGRYAEETGRRPYADQAYPEQPYPPEQQPAGAYGDYAEAPYAEDADYAEPPFAAGADPSRRRRPARGVRVGKRSGLELPEGGAERDAAEESPRYRTEMIDRQALRREGGGQTYQSGAPAAEAGFDRPVEAYPTVSPAPASMQPPFQAPTQAIPSAPPAAVYLARRPGIAWLLGLAAVVIELLLVPVLFGGLFAHNINGAEVLGAALALSGVPMAAMGLYGLACGGATASGPHVGRAWLRPPLAYLLIGLILLIAAGLAL
jgi:hypothetical protein